MKYDSDKRFGSFCLTLLAKRCWWQFEAWIEFIIKSNEYLAENKIKNETEHLLSIYVHGNNIYMKTKNSTMNETHKIVLNLLQRLDWRRLNKHVPLQNYKKT